MSTVLHVYSSTCLQFYSQQFYRKYYNTADPNSYKLPKLKLLVANLLPLENMQDYRVRSNTNIN